VDGKYTEIYASDVIRSELPHEVICFNSEGADETYEWPTHGEGARMLATRQQRYHEMDARSLKYANAWCAWADQEPGAEKPCRLSEQLVTQL
jgi:hypothetical protein